MSLCYEVPQQGVHPIIDSFNACSSPDSPLSQHRSSNAHQTRRHHASRKSTSNMPISSIHLASSRPQLLRQQNGTPQKGERGCKDSEDGAERGTRQAVLVRPQEKMTERQRHVDSVVVWTPSQISYAGRLKRRVGLRSSQIGWQRLYGGRMNEGEREWMTRREPS